MDRFLAIWPLAIVVSIIIAVLIAEVAGLITESWTYTLSEIALRRPDLAMWFVFLVGICAGGLVGHWSTQLRK